jgi:hypothetical protein
VDGAATLDYAAEAGSEESDLIENYAFPDTESAKLSLRW